MPAGPTDYKLDQSKPMTEAEIKAKIIEVQNENLKAIEQGLEQNSSGWGDKVKIKVPADAQGRPITNPTDKDWENAVKNNSFAEFEHKPADSANGEFVIDEILDIPDAGKIIAEVLAVLGPAYRTELEKANDLRNQMDSLKKKNQALEKLENSISDTNTAGANIVDDFEVPTRRYVYDEKGNKKLDQFEKPITEAVGEPPSDEDWARAAEWKSVKDLTGREVADKYFGITLSDTSEGDNAHNINLSTNIQKIGNARNLAQSEMSKLSSQFDFRMGNAQTNLQNANKIIASINDMIMGIIKGI